MIEVEAPDGSVVEFPDGTPTDVMVQAMQARFGAPQQPNALDQQSNIAAKGAAIPGDRVQPDLGRLAVTQGTLLGAGDELLSAARVPVQAGLNVLTGEGPVDPRELFAQNQAEEQAILAATREANPNASLPAELGGSLVAGGVAAPAVLRGGGVISKAVRGAGAGAGAGAFQGAATGDTIEDRGDRAVSGAQFGAVVGGALPVGGAAIGRAVQSSTGRNALRTASDALGVSRGTAQRAASAVDDSIDAGQLRTPEQGDMVLDLSGRLQGQAETIASQPGPGGLRILDAVQSRKEGAGTRIQAVLDKGISTNKGRVVVRKAQEAETKAAGRMFEAAKASGAQFDISPLRGRLNELADGIAGTADDGQLRNLLNSMPEGRISAGVLHQIRQRLDAMTSSAFRNNKGDLGRALQDVRRIADDDLKSIPGWADADAAFVVARRKEEAFEAGRGVFQRGFGDPSELAEELRGMPVDVKEDFVRGARDAVATIMGTARNDARAAINELVEKGWNKEKLRLILGDRGSGGIVKALQREKRFQDTANTISGNSRTAFRQAGQREFPNTVDSGARTRELASGGVTGITINLASKIADKFLGGALTRRAGKISDEMATLLTRTGLERDQVISTLQQLRAARGGTALSRRETVEAITQMMTVPALTANQAGQR